MMRNANSLGSGNRARRILIGILPVGMIFFVACGGGGEDDSAAKAQIAALQQQLAAQCVPGQGGADAQVARASEKNPDGTPNCDYTTVANAPASCSTYAQFKSMQCKFDALANMPDCNAAAQSFNQALMASTQQQAQGNSQGGGYGNSGNSNNNSSNNAQILLLQAQLSGSGSGNQCTAQLQKAFQDWQTFQNGLFANSQQGCQYLQNNLQLSISQVGQALQAQGNQVSIQQYNNLNNTLAVITANQSNGPCQVANQLQALLPQYLALINGQGSSVAANGGQAATGGSFNLTQLTGNTTTTGTGSTAGSLGSGSTGTVGSTINNLQLTGTGTGGTGSSYASQATTNASGSSVGSALTNIGTAQANAGAIRSGNGGGSSYDFYGGKTGSANRGAVVSSGGFGGGGGSAATTAGGAINAFNNNEFFASAGSTDGIDAEPDGTKPNDKDGVVRLRGARHRSPATGSSTASTERHVTTDTALGGAINLVY